MATATFSRADDHKILRVVLWTVQIGLAVMFGIAGALKTTEPISHLAAMLGWPGVVPAVLVRFIGMAELLGAIGLVLPSLTRIEPRVTPFAAAGLTLVMILASCFHIVRGEFSALPITLTLGLLATFVGWGRSTIAPIAPRT